MKQPRYTLEIVRGVTIAITLVIMVIALLRGRKEDPNNHTGVKKDPSAPEYDQEAFEKAIEENSARYRDHGQAWMRHELLAAITAARRGTRPLTSMRRDLLALYEDEVRRKTEDFEEAE